MDKNDYTQGERDQSREHNPQPRRPLLHVEGEYEAHDSRRDERETQHQREQCSREKWILKRDKTGKDVKQAK